jgi:hypothetical protein
MRWRRLSRMRGLPRLRRMQRLPLRRRMWWLRRWLYRDRRALGGMRWLLCIVGRLPLVLGASRPDRVSTNRDFIGRASDRPGRFRVSSKLSLASVASLPGTSEVCPNFIEHFRSAPAQARRNALLTVRLSTQNAGNRICVLTR